MSVKSLFLSLTFVMASAVSFAGHEVVPAETSPIVLEIVKDCVLTGSFTTGGTTVDVTVTSSTCAGAAATLGAIAAALDEQ